MRLTVNNQYIPTVGLGVTVVMALECEQAGVPGARTNALPYCQWLVMLSDGS